MSNRRESGALAEEKACDFLVQKGYKIIERNFRVKHGEVDIVAWKAPILVFVEVKSRATDKFGFPEKAVGSIKQSKIRMVAEVYTRLKNYKGRIQFDIISIVGIETNNCSIAHFEDCF